MNKTWITFTYELGAVLGRVSFWVLAMALPIIGLLLMGGATLLNQRQANQPDLNQMARELIEPSQDDRPKGFIDQAGLLKGFPAGFDPQAWIAYPDEESAQQALHDQRISGFFILPKNYLDRGVIYFHQLEGSPGWMGETQETIENLIAYNLLEGNQEVLKDVQKPIVEVRETNLSPQEDRPYLDPKETDFQSRMLIPSAIGYFYTVAIMTVSALLLSSLSKEQDNRIMEVLLTSSGAFPVLLGKTLALGLAGLIQVSLWGGFSLIFTDVGTQQMGLEALRTYSPAIWMWGIIFFLAGYLLYSSLMVSVGVLISGLREFSTTATMVMTPLIIPFVVLPSTMQDPNGALSTGLSLFPLTASISMLMRLTLAPVPVWQTVLALAILVLTTLVCVRLTAALFQGHMLLGLKKFSPKSLVPGFLRSRG